MFHKKFKQIQYIVFFGLLVTNCCYNNRINIILETVLFLLSCGYAEPPEEATTLLIKYFNLPMKQPVQNVVVIADIAITLRIKEERCFCTVLFHTRDHTTNCFLIYHKVQK